MSPDWKFRSRVLQCEGTVGFSDSVRLAQFRRYQAEYHEEQETLLSKIQEVGMLRTSMSENRAQETSLNLSILKTLEEAMRCGCKDSASTIREDYVTLRALVDRWIDLAFENSQMEAELEQQERVLSVVVGRLSPNLDQSAARKSLQDIIPLGPSNPQCPEGREIPANLSTREGNRPWMQSQPQIPNSEEPSDGGKRKQKDTPPSIDPPDTMYNWIQAQLESYGRVFYLHMENHHLREAAMSCFQKPLPQDLGENNSPTQPEPPAHPLKLPPEQTFASFYLGDGFTTPHQRLVLVNCWILHQLRISSLECSRISSLPEWQIRRDFGLSERDISQLVLENWFADDTVIPRSGDPSVSPSNPSSSEDERSASSRGISRRRQFHRRKRARSMTSDGIRPVIVPSLRRMSRHESDWARFLPEQATEMQNMERTLE
ncbi:hypothetical protein BO70DRAFT_121205 [Aspergillus heteromorphus CBS 117.55]|uniref:Uncharacterized protein n=1 Tax=Aspergillus heteromorphus CBS 117.55 TaxID=1448321 RepID=A0A317VET0_9EURO|nr:uncharacterized protein BO70DRAFT_121205 [Aspergillus heteromorphus CBS 117.55]PWY71701.1 hypothetical protein BO70DRAFT_121205 [Aspergillus heteromorphus CBS 117.55]